MCAWYVHAICMMCACPACAWCVPGVCMACPHTVFSNPPTCHAHTTTHTTATCRCCRAITAVAACPSTIPGMRHQQPAPLLPVLPPHPPLPPPLPHTTCAAAMHTAAAEPTAGARAATPERCCRYCLCCSLPPLLPLRCCRCKYVNIQSWLTSAASNYVNQNVCKKISLFFGAL